MGALQDEFAGKGVLRGGELMLRPKDAIAFVSRCRESGATVLGVDGFRLSKQTIQPVIEQSVDLSRLEDMNDRDRCWDRAERFLSERLTSDLFFKVVVDE